MPTEYAGNPANWPDKIQLPSDGDKRSAGSVNAALQGLADRTAHLAAALHVAEVEHYGQDDATSAHAQIDADVALGGSFVNGPVVGTLGPLEVGDLVEVIVSCFVTTSVAAPAYVRIGDTTGAAPIALNNCIVESPTGWSTPTLILIHAWWLIGGTHTGDKTLYLQARGDSGVLKMRAPWMTILRVHRGG